MNKRYCSLGLMSGTSLDGIDASIIVSDGDKELEIIANYEDKLNVLKKYFGENEKEVLNG